MHIVESHSPLVQFYTRTLHLYNCRLAHSTCTIAFSHTPLVQLQAHSSGTTADPYTPLFIPHNAYEIVNGQL